MGYGVNLFGHAPDFVREAVEETVARVGWHTRLPAPPRGRGRRARRRARARDRAAALRELGHRGDPGGRPARARGDRARARDQVRGALPRLGRPSRGRHRPRLGCPPRAARLRRHSGGHDGVGLGRALERRSSARRGDRHGRGQARRGDLRGRARLRRRARAAPRLSRACLPRRRGLPVPSSSSTR